MPLLWQCATAFGLACRFRGALRRQMACLTWWTTISFTQCTAMQFFSVSFVIQRMLFVNVTFTCTAWTLLRCGTFLKPSTIRDVVWLFRRCQLLGRIVLAACLMLWIRCRVMHFNRMVRFAAVTNHILIFWRTLRQFRQVFGSKILMKFKKKRKWIKIGIRWTIWHTQRLNYSM